MTAPEKLTLPALFGLKLAGWNEDRQVKVPTERLRSLGFEINAVHEQFLSRFDLLNVSTPGVDGLGPGLMEIDCLRCGELLAVSDMSEVERTLGLRVVPLGFVEWGCGVLAMGPTGDVYSLGDGYLAYLGESGIDALNRTFDRRPVRDIPFVYQDSSHGQDATLTSLARQSLEFAGWHADETREVAAEVERLAAHGYEVSDTTREILQKFCRLRITVRNSDGKLFLACLFDVDLAFSILSESHLSDFETRWKLRLTPIGTADNDSLILLVDSQGQIFAAIPETSDILFEIGQDVYEAINNLCRKSKLQEYGPELQR